MGRSTILPHAPDRIASLLKASPEGEGVHPSQNVTFNNPRLKARDSGSTEVD
jgi:hypothetical protein